ncbi:MAG TPA: S9 family peptidase [Actinospica sp.]|jgi:dipeptidyl aminopeptidase/acylaminoacyl peptidase|nr:S9 family peptidase [Actinospica sp.]
MALGISELLNLPLWRAFDVDDAGRILAGYDGSGTLQLVELAPDGGVTPLTALPGPCSGRYLPGERAVIVQHDDGGNERAQLSVLRLDPLAAEPVGLDGLEPLVHDGRYIHRLIDVEAERLVFLTNRRNNVDFDVVLRSTVDGTESVAYDGGGYVETAAVAPGRVDGVLSVGSAMPVSEQLLGFSGAGAEVRELTGPQEHAQHSAPQWRPDGSTLIVNSNRDREFVAVLQFDPASGEWSELVADPEHDVRGTLSPDGRTLLVAANVDGAARLSLHDAFTGALLRGVELPDEGWAGLYPLPGPAWSPDSSQIVFSFSGPLVPGDVLRLDVASGVVTTVASSTGPLAGEALVRPVAHLVPTPDGERIPCSVYEGGQPQDSELAGSAVVWIHGGPEGQSVRAFNPLVQALVLAGHTVLVPNVRGSDGYGKRWVSLDDVRLRLDSVADLAALHAYLPKLGLDQDRAALYGGSYGGYMVLAGVAFQPELWAAGVDIVGMSSLVTFLENTSLYRRAVREREYGSLEHDRDFLRQASPLTRIDDIRAPLFVIHGANDPRVPLSEAEQLTAALKANGVPCELHVYGDEGHGLARRGNKLDAYPKAMAFLATHLRADRLR